MAFVLSKLHREKLRTARRMAAKRRLASKPSFQAVTSLTGFAVEVRRPLSMTLRYRSNKPRRLSGLASIKRPLATALKVAVDHWFSKMDEEAKREAVAYAVGKAKETES